jgi:plasmid stabilization system protein ParE
MERKEALTVRLSLQAINDMDDIYHYGVETFGLKQAEEYESQLWQLIEKLSYNYDIFPECRYILTKSKMYRWIILEAHVIVYRITTVDVQVLRIMGSRRSISRMRTVRSIRW